jgi:ATP-dependent Clp protease ATP-binding subunit ClpB
MKAGFSPVYGAREMQRAIDRLIVQPLGKALLEGQFENGQVVLVDAVQDAMTFTGCRAGSA